jgi:hypothetical protein
MPTATIDKERMQEIFSLGYSGSGRATAAVFSARYMIQ